MVSDSFLISILFILLSINLLTLFALVLAIGIVVDDAIVVMEAVHAKLDEGYTSSHDASVDAMSELSSTIVAITLSDGCGIYSRFIYWWQHRRILRQFGFNVTIGYYDFRH
ncbi:MAG: efflux RND transporter permease subunit [Segetibacter sp.]